MASSMDVCLDTVPDLIQTYKMFYENRDIHVFAVHGKKHGGKPTSVYVVKNVNQPNPCFPKNEVLKVDLQTGIARFVGNTNLSAYEWRAVNSRA